MAKKNIVPIDYTSRDFNTIKRDLLTYVKRYYPDTYKDFNEASFGSMMLDTVSYVGDMLSFYLDYSANESFLETALEYDNIVKIAKQMGYKYEEVIQSFGYVDLMVSVPSKALDNEPDLNYIPKILKGSTFSTLGGNTFTLTEDVDFLNENTDVIGSILSVDGTRSDFFTLQAKGQVISGQAFQTIISVGDFQRFLKLEIPGDNVGEIISCFDAEGNEFSEVDYLSQNVIFRPIKNTSSNRNVVPHLLKPYPVPRRFIVERERERTFLIFGYGSEADIKKNNIVDPSSVALNMHGKNFVSNNVFDPSKLTSTEKFGVTPVNTTLTINYRVNDFENVNAASRTLRKVIDAKVYFSNQSQLDPEKVDYVRSSVAVDNEEPINGYTSALNTEEIKRKAYDTYALQGRAVTKQDYISAAYAMPSKFGSIKRCSVQRDVDDLKRNINLYIISEDSSGKLQKTNSAIKENLKNWLNNVRMISDTIDILDAFVVNVGIDFDIMVEDESNKYDVLVMCKEKIQEDMLSNYSEIGESLYITDVFKSLKDVPGVLDVIDVRIVNKRGAAYSTFEYDVASNMSLDGRSLEIPYNTVWEVKYPNSDIRGTVK
jgi:hypothetical protein